MNKQKEILYLTRFQELCPSFPSGEICPDEGPDFLVKGVNGDFGIDLTDFYLEMSLETHRPLQARKAARHEIMEEAKRIYHLRGLPSLFVNVHFELRFDCRQSDVHAFGETLANEKR